MIQRIEPGWVGVNDALTKQGDQKHRLVERIEPGWVQVNDALSKQGDRQHRRREKHRDQEPAEELIRHLDEEKTTIDLVA
jgi:hypothetical protein